MYKLKETAQRVTSLAGALALMLGMSASLIPASASADALNPLTERSLSLTSSSPGYHYLDGAGNSRYAPAGSGNNGQKTGELFKFKVSSAATVHAFTLQFCTDPAGSCLSPGNDAPTTGTYAGHLGDTGNGSSGGTSDFNVNFPSPSEGTVATDTVDAYGIPTAHTSTDNFQVYTNGTPTSGAASSGWTLTASNHEDKVAYPTTWTGKNNLITLTNTTGIALTSGEEVSIQFYGTDTNYITNPGLGAFFAKINTYDTTTSADLDPQTSTHIIDGGVTVANVMNDSVQIQTKVLETMSFSVGTTNPDADATQTPHGSCDAIAHNNPINLGNPNAEYSLAVARAYDGYSYWRLSSNSSNGATVYYSGYTLHNTENDHIKSIYDLTGGHSEGDGSSSVSVRGTEQFGLAVEAPNATDADGAIANTERPADTLDSAHGATSLGGLSPLVPETAYASGTGLINNASNTAHFAFKDTSLTTPEPIATEATQVIHCSTARMRYVANIAPDTPAGIYTSKINYIASPEY